MYKEKINDLEVYFICYKKEEMELIESYYDPVLNIYCFYFNCYLAYLNWKDNYKNLCNLKKKSKKLLTFAAYKYLVYMLENENLDYKLNYIEDDLIKIKPFIMKNFKVSF